ncbi:MAG: CHASE3 domain-containing protein [Variovorax sp.]
MLRRLLILLFAALAAAALIAINEIGHEQSSRALENTRFAGRVRMSLDQLLQDVVDAETGQRGYLLTGETAYRQPYDSAIERIGGQIEALQTLYGSRRDQSQERPVLDQLAKHVKRKLNELDFSVRMRASNNEAWKFVIATDVGREEMEAIRASVSALTGLSDRLADDGQVQIARSLQLSRLGITVVTLAALLAFYLYLRQTHALQRIDARQRRVLADERSALEELVRERTVALRELATHLQQVREDERSFLARELHDELGSLLTAAKLDVARLKSRVSALPEVLQRLQHLTEILNSGIALKRRIIEDLRPSSLSNLGLVAALEILGNEFEERSGQRVGLTLDSVSLDASNQLTVYRLVQQSLTNIATHAQARGVDISLRESLGQAIVEVKDDGRGFDTSHMRSTGHGLAGMRHRVEAAGGRLIVESSPGMGTLICAQIPLAVHAPP